MASNIPTPHADVVAERAWNELGLKLSRLIDRDAIMLYVDLITHNNGVFYAVERDDKQP